ncbi:MAG: alcohol dehydrogenase, zinc-containing [Verrucomicrobiaceae bacterium]|nr:alcohol dehydrogenase, zinc-containing [Verrucomicrobiaceae bacterium]
MKAVGFTQSLPADNANALIDIELPEPVVSGHDLLIEVRAVSVNPVDTKVRRNAAPTDGKPRVLGFDASGIVRAVGSACTLFKVGDEVFYAGTLLRQGSNAQQQLVDERIVGHKPTSLNFAQAAALPLTSVTAWELLFDRLQIPRGVNSYNAADNLLIVGGAGGVGSIAIQLARQLTSLNIIATASRPASAAWCREFGAHHVIDHSRSLRDELKNAGIESVRYVASLTQTEQHYAHYADIIAPQGRLGLIDDLTAPLDIRPLKSKSISLHWESMFTRSIFTTHDLIAQHEALNAVSEMVDAGQLRTTLSEIIGPINATNLCRAHALIESGRSLGKLVLEGFN